MKPEKALAERERLQEEAEKARDAADEAFGRVRKINAQLNGLGERRVAALQEQARTGEEAPVDELDAEEAELRREREQQTAAGKAARDAHKQAQREFEQLHRDEFEAFAEHADQLTAEAMGKLAALREPYDDAYTAWLAARREWNKLAGFNDLEPCAHPPLAEPAAVFSARPPRPPEVESPQGAGPLDEAPPEPEPGTVRVWEHEDGHTQASYVGDELDSVLAADPAWELRS